MKQKKIEVKTVTAAGITAALYVVLTLFSTMTGLSSGVIQVRLSEMLCILPCFSAAAIPGLFVGCFISNLISGLGIFDIILGSLATLTGAIGTYLLRKNKFLSVLPPIVSNTLIIPLVLVIYGAKESYPILMLLIAAGETVSCGIFGIILYGTLTKINKKNNRL